MADEVAMQFGIVPADTFGAFAGWKANPSAEISDTKERTPVLDEIGNEAAAHLHNEKKDYTAAYKCFADTNTPPDTIGALVGNAIMTSLSITTNNKDWAAMNLSGHQHVGVTHGDALQQAAHGITLAKAWGATDFMGGTGASGSALVSGSITIACAHQDIEDEDGDHLVGNNNNCVITATSVWNGLVTTPAVAGWDVTVVSTPSSNTGFITTTVTGVKALALAAPVAP